MGSRKKLSDIIKERIQLDRDRLTGADRRRLNRLSERASRPVGRIQEGVRNRSVKGRVLLDGRVKKLREDLSNGLIGLNPYKKKKRRRVT